MFHPSYKLALCLTASVTLALPAQASLDPEAPSSRVANAEKVKECDFPPVVYVSGCTGTLVHPKVVVYAWHCGRPKSVKFTEAGKSRKGFSVPATCKTVPGGRTNSKDWAYCILSREVTEIPIVPVVAGCEYEMISKGGQEVVQVGFGQTHNSGPGIKHWGISEVTKVSGGVVTVGDKNSVVACPGDSGGPLMVRMEDKSWRTIGILSTYNRRCGKGGVNWYSDVHTALPWIEKDSGIDITPCFNDKGEWEPGPDCGGFYAGNPSDPQGNWTNKCEGTLRSGRSSTCGPAAGGKADEEAPEAEITSPEDGDSFDEDATIKVKVKATDNVGVKEVELFVDGDSKGSKEKKPYTWEIEGLSSGTIEIKAVAKDEAGNEGKSEVIELKIKSEEDSDSGEESASGGESDSGSNGESDGDSSGNGANNSENGDSEGGDDSDNGSSANASDDDDDDDKKRGCAVGGGGGWGWLGLVLGVGLLRRRD